MRLTANYSVCVLISACIDPFHTTPLLTVSQKYIYYNGQSIISEWSLFEVKKFFIWAYKKLTL